jgi:DNA-binding Xre family transcriptional regulator
MNMTQRELAEKIGVSRAWWTMMENRDPPIQIDTLLKVCNALGCNLADFFSSIYGLKKSAAERTEEKAKKALTKSLKKLGISAEVSVVLKHEK